MSRFISRASIAVVFAFMPAFVACSSKDDGGGTEQEGDAAADATPDADASAHDASPAPDASVHDAATIDDASGWHDPNDGSWNPDAVPQSN